MRLAATLLALLLAATPASAVIYFSDSFSTCDASAWDLVLMQEATDTYPSTGCQDAGCCARATITSPTADLETSWQVLDTNENPSHMEFIGYWKFESGWVWPLPPPLGTSIFYKAVIWDIQPSSGRLIMNFNSITPTTAQLCVISEGLPQSAYICDPAAGITIGTFHKVEVHWDRATGVDAGHVTVWLNGVKVIDSAITTCGITCKSFNRVQVGAYHNWPISNPPISFLLDNVTFTFDDTIVDNCGNGVINSGEQCDGANLNSQTCLTQGFIGGTLSCSGACTFVTTGCTSPPATPDTPMSGVTIRGTTLR